MATTGKGRRPPLRFLRRARTFYQTESKEEPTMSTKRHRSFLPRLVHALNLLLSCLLFIVFVVILITFLTDLIVVVRNSQFSQSGIATQGIVIGVSGPGTGGKCHQSYTVQFTDRVGHAH